MPQHWYQQDGSPAHFMGSGGSPTTLREARKFGLYPSVTTVLDLIAKPGLERWKRDQSVLAALTLPRLDGESSGLLLERIEQDAARQAQEAAEVGFAIHAAIEASFALQAVPEAYTRHVSAVRQILVDNFPEVDDWVIEKSFAHPAGFGGKVDIHSPRWHLVGDHKGVAVAPDEKKQLTYDQHWQLGAYAEGLGMPADARGFNIFVSRTHPGHVRFHEWSPEKMRQGRLVFMDTLRLWQSIRGYQP